MILFPAYAETVDTSGSSSMIIILLCAGFICLVSFLAIFPIIFARGRANRHYETISAAVILWALISAGTMIYTALNQMQWQKEYALRIQSGYFDPQDATGQPHQPWFVWGVLAVAYCILLAWARIRPTAVKPANDQHLI